MAPRRPQRTRSARSRGAGLAACLWLAATAASAQITSARFEDPTQGYPHCILGDCVTYRSLVVFTTDPADGASLRYVARLPEGLVFEDIAPRLWDITGDGSAEVVVVLTSTAFGASLAVFGPDRLIAQTPYIGQPNRWLAPVGAADFDGDGRMEVAFVDRPHLAKVLRVFEWDGTALRLEAERAGLTNHRIGEGFITGGVRDCGNGPEIVTANADWTAVMATRLRAGALQTTKLSAFSAAAVADALGC